MQLIKNIRILTDVKKAIDISKPLFRLEQKRNHQGKNNIWSTFAETGSGKTYVNIANMEVLEGPDWKNEWIHFEYIAALQEMKKAPYNTTRLIDEQREVYGTGVYSMEGKWENIEETVRANRLNFGHASPGLKSHVHHFIFKVFHLRETKEPLTITYKKKEYKIGTEGISYCIVWKPDTNRLLDLAPEDIIGMAKFPCPKNTEELIKYTKRKADFIEETQQGKQTSVSIYEGIVEEILKEKESLKLCKKKPELKSFVINWLRKKGEGITIAEQNDVVNMVILEARRRCLKYAFV